MSKGRDSDGRFAGGNKASVGARAGTKRMRETLFRGQMQALSKREVLEFLTDQLTFKKRRKVERVYERDIDSKKETLVSEKITETESYGKWAADAAREVNLRAWGKPSEPVQEIGEDGEDATAGFSEKMRQRMDEELLGITPEVRALANEASVAHKGTGDIH